MEKGGPEEMDYALLVSAFSRLHSAGFVVEDGLSRPAIELGPIYAFLETNKDVFRSTSTLQGFCYSKPHGYAGDFEIIEKIYRETVSRSAKYERWDRFFHQGAPAKAVRNRASLLGNILDQISPGTMLSVGCGPALDIVGAFANRSHRTKIDFLDNDLNALRRAQANIGNAGLVQSDKYILKNALRFRPEGLYDLVWCSGLFDYLNSKTARYLLRRMRAMTVAGGMVAVGNFSTANPCRGYLEVVGNWYLRHRSQDEMLQFAIDAEFSEDSVEVRVDDTELNLLLVAKS